MTKRNKILIAIGLVALVFIVRLFVVQVTDKSYKMDARNNSMVHITVYPTRGRILDRNGRILVDNKTRYDLMVTPVDVRPFDTLKLARILKVDKEWIVSTMAYYKRYRTKIGYKSLTFIHQMESEDYLRFAEVEWQFPGFYGQPHSTRKYLYNAGGNLLGYISEVDAAYIKRHPEYKSGDYAGRTGIEAVMESVLKGQNGDIVYSRDSKNKIVGHYHNGEMDVAAVPGSDVVTTICAPLQEYGQRLMNGKIGSLVAIEPSSGEILALVSSPGVDVDVLADFSAHYKEIASDPLKPMFNRAVQASYPPGSVFKLMNCLIGLQCGTLHPWYRYPCTCGYHYGNGKTVGCHAHRSPLDMQESIMMSCNAYYCYVLKDLIDNPELGSSKEAFDKWYAYVRSFGFGGKLGTDLPYELGGNVPKSETYDKIYGKGHWKANTIISLSIGQGEIGCTPMHLANFCATIANRGWYRIPHIIKESASYSLDPKYTEKHRTMVDSVNFLPVIEGMYRAVNSGYGSGATASVACMEGLDICGKTGTAQNPHGDDHSVFICFAPKDHPRIAVAAYVEHGTWGATWAAPIASLMVEEYLLRACSCDTTSYSRPPERVWLEKRMMEGNLIEDITSQQGGQYGK